MNLHFGYILSILLAALLLPAMRAAACPTAADLSHVGSEPGAALADCTALSRFEIPTGRGPIAGVVYGVPDADPALVAGIKAALIRSGNVLRGLGALGTEPIEAYISPTPYVAGADGGDARAVASSAVDTGPENPSTCIIVMFQGNPRDELGPVVAHEFFHCVQFEEFSAQDAADGSEWWAEGTADWFTSLVYQGNDLLDAWVASFDVLSVDTPITRMEYDNVVFFWWRSQNFGTGAVIDLIEAMPGPGGSQNDALARVVDDDMFLQFVQDYLDQKITQPGGRAIPFTPIFGPVFQLRTNFKISLNAARFVAFRVRMQLDCGEWTTSDNDVKGRYELRRLPGDTWETLPEIVRSDSEDTIRYQMAAGGTGVEGFNIEISLEKPPVLYAKT